MLKFGLKFFSLKFFGAILFILASVNLANAAAKNSQSIEILNFRNSDNSVIIGFSKPISIDDFNRFNLKGEPFRVVFDIPARLKISSNELQISGGVKKNGASVRIAQNSAQITRMVISAKDEPKITLGRHKNEITISIKLAQKNEESSKKVKKDSIKSAKELFSSTNIKKQDPAKSKKESAKSDKKEDSIESNQNKKSVNKKIQNSKIIVLDPGHGGRDCGASGVAKICEKRIVFAVAEFLREELKERGYAVQMTRTSDKYVDLPVRTQFANSKNADIFVSIHANSIKQNANSTQGIETYFLSQARSERALKVAEAENAANTKDMSKFSKNSFLNSMNYQRIVASNRLAIDIQFGMLQSARAEQKSAKSPQKITDGGVREGPFWVLAGALMPSVLLEIGYLSHPNEGKLVAQKAHQKALAKGIADGIDGYFAKNP